MNDERTGPSLIHPHDSLVLDAITRSLFNPQPFESYLERSGRLAAALVEQAPRLRSLRFLPALIERALGKGLEGAVETAARSHRQHEVRRLYQRLGVQLPADGGLTQGDPPLEVRDRVAQDVQKRSLVLMGTEGIVLGGAASFFTLTPAALVAIPGVLSADVFASLTFCARHCFLLAQVYGLPAAQPSFRAHIFMAMAPLQMDDVAARRLSLDPSGAPIVVAGYEQHASTAHARRLALNAVAAQTPLVRTMLSGSAPGSHLLRLVGARLKASLTQKQAGLFIPVAGGAVNGLMNLAFQKMCHRNAQIYFQLLYLSGRYGSHRILDEVQDRLQRLSV